jgi:hypothetical protein
LSPVGNVPWPSAASTHVHTIENNGGRSRPWSEELPKGQHATLLPRVVAMATQAENFYALRRFVSPFDFAALVKGQALRGNEKILSLPLGAQR